MSSPNLQPNAAIGPADAVPPRDFEFRRAVTVTCPCGRKLDLQLLADLELPDMVRDMLLTQYLQVHGWTGLGEGDICDECAAKRAESARNN